MSSEKVHEIRLGDGITPCDGILYVKILSAFPDGGSLGSSSDNREFNVALMEPRT
jgi:hypothetical protein